MSGYVPALDGIRAVAVLCVMAAHLDLLPLGGLGVDIFFVLSGFLITGVLLREWQASGRVSLRRFYVRRALRLLPALAVLVAAINLVAVFVFDNDAASSIRWHSLAVLLYVANWLRAFGVALGPLGHLWSVSIEEQFYLLWPVLLLMLLKRGAAPKRIGLAVALIALTVPFYRAWLWHGIESFHRIYNGLDTRADQLMIGCGLALCGPAVLPRRLLAPVTAIGAAFLASVMIVPPSIWFQLTFGSSFVAMAAASLVATAAWEPHGRLIAVLASPPLVWIGRLSYGFYLWHYPVFLLGWWNSLPPVLAVLMKVAATTACVSVSFYLIEQPCLKLKDRFRGAAAGPKAAL